MGEPASNKELVLKFWRSRPTDQPAFLTDDAVWHLPPSIADQGFADQGFADQGFGGATELRGDAARAIFSAATDVYEPGGSMDVLHVVAEADLVALHCQLHTRTKAGHDYHGSYHMLFRIEGDRIAETWEFLDTAYLAECRAPLPGR
jgi:ketosteroid isomerase-like protein